MATLKPIPFGSKPIAKPTGAVPFGATPTNFPTQAPPEVHQTFMQKLGNALVTPQEQSDIKDAFSSSLDYAKQGYQEARNVKSNNPIIGFVKGTEGALKAGAGLIGAVASPLAPITKNIKPAVETISSPITNIPAVQKFSTSKAGDVAARGLEDVANAGVIAGTVAGAMELPKTVSAVGSEIKNTAGRVIEKINAPKEIAPLNANKVTDLYNRAIRPTVVGKRTAGQISKANTNVVSGLQAIAENKPSLSFTDANGEITANAAPKTVDQLTQSIAQTKKTIFSKYDALAKQAGEQGVSVETPKIAAELTPVINSKSLAIANPKAVEYAKGLQQRLTDAGMIDAETAQDVIQHYNDSLKAFYRNPSYETASSASIDALIANKFRAALDEGITNATGEQYQALKNQYGALSSMEKDVAHRNIVWGRQNNVGLGSNIANIASGAELVRALVNLNPTDLAISGAIKGIQKYIQYLNNPDVGVAKIFKEIERASQAKPPIPKGEGAIPKTSTEIIPKNDITLYKGIGGEAPNINRMAYGSHFADNPKLAGEYGKTIINETIPKGTKIANLDLIREDYAKKGILADPQKITQDLIDKGYEWARGSGLGGGKVEYVKLQGIKSNWHSAGDWMPGEPIQWIGGETPESAKFVITDTIKGKGLQADASGKYSVYSGDKLLKDNFKTINEATKFAESKTTEVLIGQKAIDNLVKQKSGEIKGALFHPDLGKIDVVWGEGTHGLAHIKPAVRNNLAEIISKSKLIEKGKSRAFLETADHRSVIALDWIGTPKQWVLTSYKKK